MKKVTIPVEFVDTGKTAQKIAENLSKAIGKSNLSVDIKKQTESVIKDLEQYAGKIGKFNAGDVLSTKDFKLLSKESKTTLKGVQNLIKDIKKEARESGFSDEIIKELEAIDSQISKSTTTLKANQEAHKKLQKFDVSPQVPGFGNLKDIDLISKKIDDIRAKKKALEEKEQKSTTDKGTVFTKKDTENLKLYKEQLQGIESIETEIKERKEQQRAIKLDNTALEKSLDGFNKELIKTQKASDGNPLVDPEEVEKIATQTRSYSRDLEETSSKISLQREEYENSSGAIQKFSDNVQNSIKNLFGYAAVFAMLKRVVRESIRTIKELDQSFTEIAMVTTMSTQEVWKMKDAFVELANSTGQTISGIAELSVSFFRQGRSVSETLKLVEAAGMAAKIANISAADSADYLTSAINAYQMSASQAMAVSDKFAALAASSASSYEELAIALSKVAAQAYAGGVEMDNLMGFLAKGIETTREAPENIGTAFKTIFARMSEIKSMGVTFEDGMDISRVDTALKAIGVELTNTQNELRDLDDVLMEVGANWNGLNKNQKAYVATALAGTRQQTRLIAVMENFDRTMELTQISSNSLGASLAQQSKYYDSIEYSMTKLTNAWQNFITNIVKSDFIITVTDILSTFIRTIDGAFAPIKGLVIAMAGLTGAFAAFNAVMSFGFITKTIDGIVILLGKLKGAKIATELAKINLAMETTGKSTSRVSSLLLQKLALWIKNSTAALGFGVSSKVALGMATAGVTILIGALITVIGWFGKLIYNTYKLRGNLKNLAATSRQFGAELYNATKKGSDIGKLIEEYEALDNQLYKTNEQLATMAELGEQIQDLIGDEGTVLNIDGELNVDAVKEFLENNAKDLDETFEEAYTNAIKGMKTNSVGIEDLDATTRNIIYEYEALEEARASGIASTREEFLQLDKETQDYYKNLAKAQSSARYADIQSTPRAMSANVQNFIPSLDTEALEKLKQQLNATVFNAWQTGDMTERAAILLKLGYENADTAHDKYINTMLDGATTINEIQKIFGEGADEVLEAMGTNIRLYDVLAEQISTLNLTVEQSQDIIGNVIQYGGTEAFNKLQKDLKDSELSFNDLIDVANTLNDLEFADIDTNAMTVRLQSIGERINEFKGMMEGAERMNLEVMKEMIMSYEGLAELIANNGDLSMKNIESIMKGEDDRAKNALENEIISYENRIGIIDLELKAYQEMLDNETYLASLTQEEFIKLNELGLEAMFADFKQFSQGKTKFANREAQRRALAEQLIMQAAEEGRVLSAEAATNLVNRQLGNVGDINLRGGDDFSAQAASSLLNYAQTTVKATIDALQTERNQLQAFISINRKAIADIDSGAFWKDATDDAKNAMKEYEAQIDALYIALQQLAAVDSMISQFEQMQEYAKSGEEFVVGIWAMNEALEIRNEVLKDVIKIQKQEQASLINSLGSLNQYTKVVNGKLQVSLKDYIKLTDEQKELIDDVVQEYDSLTDSINDNSLSINENTAQIEKNNKILRDTTLKLQEDIRKAIENEEKKKLDIIKKSIAAEKKLLDERKKLYQDSFEEEDYNNELNEIDQERQSVIQELAGLEGATGAQANRRRQELLRQKAELDKNYNEKVRDYNREAVLEGIELEQQALDEKEQAAQDAFDNFINDTDAMQARINEIMEGSADEILGYLMEHSDAYANALELDRQNMETEWGTMIGIVKTALVNIDEGIPEEYTLKYNIPDFVSILGDINNLADGLSKIPSSITTTHTINTVNTSSGSTPPTGEAANKVTTGYVWGPWTKVSATQERRQQFKVTYTNGKETKREVFKTEFRQTASNVQQSVTTSDRYSGVTYQKFDKGGIADFTGPAWLDGTKRRPERILSPVQTQLFEQMVASLEEQKRLGMTTNNSEVTIGPISVSLASGTKEQAQEAGRLLADEVKKAMKTRGIAVNTKITKY